MNKWFIESGLAGTLAGILGVTLVLVAFQLAGMVVSTAYYLVVGVILRDPMTLPYPRDVIVLGGFGVACCLVIGGIAHAVSPRR